MDTIILQELIIGCKHKDRNSQKRLYQGFYSCAMKICIRYAKDKEEAIELVNDGFMRVFVNIDRYNKDQPFEPWFCTIMINISIDHYRKQIKRIEMEELNAKHELGDKENILTHIHYEELVSLVQKLSAAYRAVFNLFVIDGYSHEEISALLSISVGTSKSNLFKARVQLQKMLKVRP